MSIDYDNLTDAEYEETIADFLWPDSFEIFTVFVFLSLMVIGVSGNCLVVFVVIRNKKLVSDFFRNTSFMILTALSFSAIYSCRTPLENVNLSRSMVNSI